MLRLVSFLELRFPLTTHVSHTSGARFSHSGQVYDINPELVDDQGFIEILKDLLGY